MPEAFDKCVRNGGRVRTISGPDKHFKVPEGHYRKVCWLENEPFWGHLKKSKENKD